MYKYENKSDFLICPWCYSAFETPEEAEELICPICKREIRKEDIEYAEQQDN